MNIHLQLNVDNNTITINRQRGFQENWEKCVVKVM